MASRALDDLLPFAREKARAWQEACRDEGVDPLIYCTWRSAEEQDGLYAMGRSEPGRIVTRARAWKSWHQYRVAWDACPLFAGKPDWKPFKTAEHERQFRESGNLALLGFGYRVMVVEAEKLGIEWAGRWKSLVEYVHFQFPDGHTMEELRKLL